MAKPSPGSNLAVQLQGAAHKVSQGEAEGAASSCSEKRIGLLSAVAPGWFWARQQQKDER